MDASKVKTSQPVQAVQAAKRNPDSKSQQAAQTKSATAQKSPYDAPRQTTNGQGQTIGTRINYSA
jgi:hypothetical protein